MKKIISFITLTLLVFSSLTFCISAQGVAAEFKIGTVSGNPGDTVSVPVEITSEGKLSTLVMNVSFDDEALEYIPYARATDKGDISFNIIQVDKTIADDSVLGIIFIGDVKKLANANGTLIKLRFKIKEDATDGNKNIKIEKIELSEAESADMVSSFTKIDGYVEVESEVTGSDAVPETPAEDDFTEELPEEDLPEEDREETDNGGNGTVDIAPVVGENEKEEAPEVNFSDLTGFEWAEDYILPLAKKGIIKGTSENTFSPGENITRADFILLLMRLLEISGEKGEGFSDVSADAYFADAVNCAKEMGIAKGTDGKFNPYSSITRQDMVVLVYRALIQMSYLPVIPDDDTFDQKYSDISDISDYALEAMKELSKNEIITGSGGMINPKGLATRAETAVIISRISNLIPQF